ncbi:MAG: hypothetical protein JSR82_23745 [Verrucomicrobia bacterium]|nr:hypothetical protein [Verrucomicrobiota bacterium]
MAATYIYNPTITTIQGCVEQPGTMVETSYSGLETLTFSFRGEPAKIFDLQSVLTYFAVPPIAGNWQNFRVVSSKITENDGVWARLSCVAKGLRGNPPQPTTKWSKQLQSLQNVQFAGHRYASLYYLSPSVIISRVQLVGNGFTTEPEPAPPEFGSAAKVQLLTLTGYLDVEIPGAIRACQSFEYQQQGIYWEIQETWGITIPQPGEGEEFSFAGSQYTIYGFSWGPNFTTNLFS